MKKRNKEMNNTTTLTTKDLDNPEISKIGSYYYRNKYGSWNNFLNYIGEPYNHFKKKHTTKDLIDNYFEVKKKLGRQPKLSDLYDKKLSNISGTNYQRSYGSFAKFLKSINEPLHKKESVRIRHTKQNLINNYYYVKEKLGKIPRQSDFDDESISSVNHQVYFRMYGNYSKFLKSINECNPRLYRAKKQDLITNYYEVKKKIGRIPGYNDLIDKNISRISYSAYKKNFGGLTNFLKYIDENKISQCHFCKKDFIRKENKQKYCSKQCYSKMRYQNHKIKK